MNMKDIRIHRSIENQSHVDQITFQKTEKQMAYNEKLAQHIRPIIQSRPCFTEKHMFGGVGFLLSGNMCCGVYKEFLICRLGGSPSR